MITAHIDRQKSKTIDLLSIGMVREDGKVLRCQQNRMAVDAL